MFCRGSMVDLLVSSRISRYAEFKAVTRILTHINSKLEKVRLHRVFPKRFWCVGWGVAFVNDFECPFETESDWRGLAFGTEPNKGSAWKNCPLRPKMPPCSKIRANFGVLSIK